MWIRLSHQFRTLIKFSFILTYLFFLFFFFADRAKNVFNVYKTTPGMKLIVIILCSFILNKRMGCYEGETCTFLAMGAFSLPPPPTQRYGCSSACPAADFGNSHSCASTIQGIRYHRHLGKVLDGCDWCLRVSVTDSSCLEPDNSPGGTVNLAD